MMLHNMTYGMLAWVLVGLSGQIVFAGRFFVQWLQSERQGKSVIPIPFWYMSIIGSLILLVYAFHLRDPVFILGQGSGMFIYIRNLHLIYRERKRWSLQNKFNEQSVAM